MGSFHSLITIFIDFGGKWTADMLSFLTWVNIIYAKLNLSKCSQQSSSSAVRDLWGGLQWFCTVSRFTAFHVQCYQLIFVDQKLSYSESVRILAPSSPSLLHLVASVSILLDKLFPLIFSVWRSFGWFMCSRVAMDASLWLWHLSPQPLRHKFPSSSICYEFN